MFLKHLFCVREKVNFHYVCLPCGIIFPDPSLFPGNCCITFQFIHQSLIWYFIAHSYARFQKYRRNSIDNPYESIINILKIIQTYKNSRNPTLEWNNFYSVEHKSNSRFLVAPQTYHKKFGTGRHSFNSIIITLNVTNVTCFCLYTLI